MKSLEFSKSASAVAPSSELSLRDQLLEMRDRFPGWGWFLLLLATWVLAFNFYGNPTLGYVNTPSLFAWTVDAIKGQAEEDDLGLYAPIVVVFLLWWTKADWMPKPKKTSAIGGLCFAGAVLLHMAGYVFQQPKICLLAFIGGLHAMVWMLWGWRQFMAILFPGMLLLFTVPLGQQGEMLTVPLRKLVSVLSVGFSHSILGLDVMREGSLIFNGARSYQYDVAPACSGIRSLTALGFIVTIVAFLQYTVWWKRGVLLMVVAPLAVLGNTIRIIAVIIAGEMAGQEAGAAIEQKLGFLTFLVALGGVFGVAWLMDRPWRATKSANDSNLLKNEVAP